jgi:hypothetical protein
MKYPKESPALQLLIILIILLLAIGARTCKGQSSDSALIKDWNEFKSTHYDTRGNYINPIKENLFKPNHYDFVVAWCDYDRIYFIKKITKKGKIKIGSIRNVDHEMFYKGDLMILRDEFRYNH